MKYLLLLITLYAATLQAQNPLRFDKRFVESEDHWVAFRMDPDSTYSYGFIYIDAQAGLTLNHEGKFRIARNGAFLPLKSTYSGNMKVRLQPNQVRVAFIPPAKFAELNISPVPGWLKSYKTDTTSTEHLYRWGFLYNAWDESAKALTYLERARQQDPKFPGLGAELAYAYNALQQYDKAIEVLEGALLADPNECYLYKELTFALIHSDQLPQAEKACVRGISLCKDKPIKSEIAYNLAQRYYQLNDRPNFTRWAKESRKWATAGDVFMVNLAGMEAKLAR